MIDIVEGKHSRFLRFSQALFRQQRKVRIALVQVLLGGRIEKKGDDTRMMMMVMMMMMMWACEVGTRLPSSHYSS